MRFDNARTYLDTRNEEGLIEGVDPPPTIFCDIWIDKRSFFELKGQPLWDLVAVGTEPELFVLYRDRNLAVSIEALELFARAIIVTSYCQGPGAIVLYAPGLAHVQVNFEIG
jgi:hypothetical protein